MENGLTARYSSEFFRFCWLALRLELVKMSRLSSVATAHGDTSPDRFNYEVENGAQHDNQHDLKIKGGKMSDDLEKQTSLQKGDLQAQDTQAAKKHWIRTAPESPRNWPYWKKWWIIAGLNFYTVVVFVCNTGFVTDDATDHFGVNEESSVCGQSMVSVYRNVAGSVVASEAV
jgi:hypothetical protein